MEFQADPSTAEPLSPSQVALWIVHSLHPTNSDYTVQVTLRFALSLQREVVASALAILIARHSILGATYHLDHEGIVKQYPNPEFVPDLSATRSSSPAQTQELLAAFLERPFDLTVASARALLVAETDGSSVLSLATHHIANDGRSREILAEELADTCLALSNGRRPNLPPAPTSYSQYARYTRSDAAAARSEAGLAYWHRTLSGSRPLDLPIDGGVKAGRSSLGSRVPFHVDAWTAAELRRSVISRRASFFALLASAAAIGLWRWTGDQDVVLGTVLSGRRDPAFARTVGFFVNTVALRCQVSPEMTRHDVLVAMQSATALASRHQGTPFPEVVRVLNPRRSAERNPVFNALLIYDGEIARGGGLPGGVEMIDEDRPVVRFEVEIATALIDSALDGSVRYRRSSFRESTARRLAEMVRSALLEFCGDLDRPLGDPLRPARKDSTL